MLPAVASAEILPQEVSVQPMSTDTAMNAQTDAQGSYLINPWTKEHVYYQDAVEDSSFTTSSIVTPEAALDNHVFYDEAALKNLEKLKQESTSASLQSQQDSTDLQYQQMTESKNTLSAQTNDQFAAKALTKAQYRGQFKELSLTFGAFSCPTAGNFLLHSLQDSPSNRSYAAGTTLSNGFSRTPSYTEISIPIANAVKTANAQGKKAVSGSGSHYTSAGNAGLDWYLTLGKYKHNWAAEKMTNGTWTIYINVNDRYDYTHISPIPSSLPAKAIALVSNHAADAQNAGAIVPYISNFYMQQPNYRP